MLVDIFSLPLGRDPFSMWSHLIGASVAPFATFFLVWRARQNNMRGLGVGVYGLSMTLALSLSALFHYVDPESARLVLYHRLDHMGIFLLIAGTGTAIYGSLDAPWTLRLTILLWAATIIGIIIKLMFWPTPPWLTALIYLVIGWLGCLGVIRIGWVIGWRPIRLFILGGIAYTIAAVVFIVEWPVLWSGVIESHGLFHVLILLGAALHFVFIYQHCARPSSFQVVKFSESEPGVLSPTDTVARS